MRIPFMRRPSEAATEAREAREKAERDLAATQAETPKYRALGRTLREIRENNNLREHLTDAFRSTS